MDKTLVILPAMKADSTIAGTAKETMHAWLQGFCRARGISVRKAADTLKCKGLSAPWIEGFAHQKITNPTVGKLRNLERRLREVEASESVKAA